MKKVLGVAVIATAAMMSTGCISKNSAEFSSPLQTQLKAELRPSITVGDKISGESSATVLLGIFTLGAPTTVADGIAYTAAGDARPSLLPISRPSLASKVRAAAAYNAVNNAKADIIVAPQYVVETKNFVLFQQVNVKVEGYKGTITKIEQVTTPAK